MSDSHGARADRGAALSGRARAIIAMGLAGLVVGFLWGVADVPRYSATATVLVTGNGGAPAEGAELEAAAQRAESAKVAERAAGLLGADVGGADLLSDITVSTDPGAGAVRIEAEADSPDFAAAAANGYATALVGAGGKDFEEGAAASIPSEPSENRSAALWSLIGLIVGLIAGTVLVALRGRGAGSARRESAPAAEPPTGAGAPGYLPVADAFGAPVLASFARPEYLLDRDGGGEPGLDGAAAGTFLELADELDLGRGGPRRLAVLDVAAGDGSLEVLVGLAAAADERGLNAIVVEGDVSDPALAALLGVGSAPGLSDYLRGAAGPREVLRSAPVRAGGERMTVVCVPAGAPGDLPEGVDGERFAGLMERLPRVYDLVLVSAPPVGDGGGAAAVAGLCDGVVLVSADDEGAGGRIAGAVEALAGSRLLGGVLTGSPSAQSRPQSAVRASSSVKR